MTQKCYTFVQKQTPQKTHKKETKQPTQQTSKQPAPKQNLITAEQKETLINLIESAGFSLSEEMPKIKDLTTERYDKAVDYYTQLALNKNLK